MKNYLYKMKDENGKTLHGFLEADDLKELKRRLRPTNLFFMSAEPYDRKKISEIKANLEALLVFTRRLSSLIESGIPILTTMNILWRQTEDQTFQLVVSHIRQNLEEGKKISEALNDFPRIFPPVYIAMIAVAEKTGGMVVMLRRLVEYLEYQKKFITRTKKATLYPAIVLSFAFLVIIFMFAFVVPTFQKVLVQLKVELPILTQIIIMISETIRSPFFIVGVVLIAVLSFYMYRFLRKDKKFSYKIDEYKLKIPVVGNILHSIALSRFLHSLGILLGAGLPIIESLEVSKTTMTNQSIAASIDQVQEKIEQGESVHEAFKGIKMFPLMLIEMVGVAEASGTIVKVLSNLAVQYDEETDYNQNKFFTMLEPILILFVGGIILITLLAIYLPIISIWNGLMVR